MNKSLLFFCLLTLNLSYISQAQVADTMTTESDTNIYVAKCYINAQQAEVVLSPTFLKYDYAEYNLPKMLDGRIPGLQTTNGGGQPGSSAEMMIRGMSSLSGNNSPLIVLDGIPYYGDLSSINLKDISNVNLLKDATATFDFGNRGGNGILYINTKDKTGCVDALHKPHLEVDAKFGVSTQALPDYATVGTGDFYETMYSAIQNGGVRGNVVDYLGGYNSYHLNGVGDSLQDEYLIDPTTGKLNSSAQLKYQDNWRKEMRRIGIRQSYDIASSARNGKGGYYFSAGYLNDKGYVKQTGFKRYSARFNSDYKPLKWLTVGLRAQGVAGEQQYADPGLFKSTQLMAPIYPVYYRNSNGEKEKDPATGTYKYDWGSLTYAPDSSIGNRNYLSYTNSIASLYRNSYLNKSYMVVVNPYLEISFLKDFAYTADFSYNYNKQTGQEEFNEYGSHAFHNTFKTLNVKSLIHKLKWDKTIKKHHLTWILANEIYKYNIEAIDSSGSNQSNNYLRLKSFASAKNYYTKIQYDFSNKYILFAGARKDGYAYDKYEWVNNAAVGAAYVLSGESFMQDIRWINNLKFKASYGTQENNLIGYNQLFTFYLQSSITTGNNFRYGTTKRGNQLNIGLESDFFANSISFEANIYSRNSGEMVLEPYYYPSAGGIQFNYRDAPFEYNNQGIELNIYTRNINNNNFGWNTVFNFTHNRNMITSMPPGFDSVITRNNLIYKKGNSMADFYMVEYAGVDPNNGDALYYAKDGNGNEIKTSDYWHAVETNRKNFGSAFPAVYGSMTNKFIYKNFELSIQVNYSLGGKYYDEVYQDLMNNGNNANNWSTDILNYWTPGNRITNVPRLDVNGLPDSDVSSRFLRSASYLNIANLYLGYSFNEAKIKKAKMKSLRVYLTASNLWMFAASKGMNPQGSFYGTPGYVYLPARSVMLGLNVGI